MVIKDNASTQPPWALWLTWVLISVAAYVLLGFAFHFPSGFPPNNGERFNTPALIVGAFPGGFTVLVIGLLQALLLRQYFKGVRWWIVACVVSLAITHAIGDALSDSIALPVVQVTGGLLLGAAQWFVLKNQGLTAVVWTLASAVAWFVGLTLGLAIAKQIGASWQIGHIIAGLVTGISIAAVTGALLVRLVRNLQHGAKTS